jgi:Zn-dependent protease/predicted transcriptional regulator
MTASGGPGSLRVARLLGIPVYVHYSWILVFALIAWTLATDYFPGRYPELAVTSHWARGLAASALFFVSVLLHELGHSVVAIRSGIEIQSITLFIFGGVARLASEPRDGRTELRIAAAGPAVSMLLAALFAVVATGGWFGGGVSGVASYLAMVNLVVAVFNLVPAFPLDGGRLLRGLLWRPLGKVRATRTAAGAGTFFAYFLILTGAVNLVRGAAVTGIWHILLGWFLKEAAISAYRQVRLDDALEGLLVADVMIREVQTIPADLPLSEAVREHFGRTGFGAYPVVRGDAVVGLLCLRDALRQAPEERQATSVQAAMMPLTEDLTAQPDELLADAVSRLGASSAGRLIVMSGGRMVGLVTLRAVMRRMAMQAPRAGVRSTPA